MKKRVKSKKIVYRCDVLMAVGILLFLCITFKLINLQITRSVLYKAKANIASHRFIKEFAPRGQIIDATKTVLATNKQSFNITYIQTDDNKTEFYNTAAKVFYILDKNGEKQDDKFELKLDGGYRFDFNTSDIEKIKRMKLRFLKDRGFEEDIIKNMYKGKRREIELTECEKKQVDDKLLKISAKEAFEKLITYYEIPKKYSITVGGQKIIKICDLKDLRRFMVVKDAVKMNIYSGYKPVVIAKNVKEATAFEILQKSNELMGINISVEPIRYYPYGKLASNVLGYISKIAPSNSKEIDAYKEKGYDVNTDLIGMTGIEAALENRMRGTSGGKIVDVNKYGKITGEIAKKDPYPGQNVQLTINKDVQYAAEQSLINTMSRLRQRKSTVTNSGTAYLGNATRGAAVAIDVKTGGVIALASVPNFNPNDFSNPSGISNDVIEKYFLSDILSKAKDMNVPEELYNTLFPKVGGVRTDKYDYLPKPLYDYATLSLIPPGSTFKLLTAVAGLETGVITKDTKIDDPGYFIDGNYKVEFKADGPQGTNNLIAAISKSSNAYFMTVGKYLRQKCGSNVLAKYAWKFGLGVPPESNINPSTGIEIKENFGQVYNTYTSKNSFAQQGQWFIMEELKNEKYLKGISIDLYTSDSDSKQLSNLKIAIKDNIKTSISTGKFDKNKIENLIDKLVNTDSMYKNKKISKSDIEYIASSIVKVEEDQYNQATTTSNIYGAAIGQGINEFTPLQLANYVATIASNGKRHKVHLIDRITNVDGKVVYENRPEVVEDAAIKKSTIDVVKEGMNAVDDSGTASGTFAKFPILTAGKTGTADPYSIDTEKAIKRTSYAVYVGFAPRKDPRIAVATVVFDGGFGSGITNIAKDMYEAYFKDILKEKNFKFDVDVDAKPENYSENNKTLER
ncbi:penicillin-binding transpeptidase domain-containing protein [Clostridium felsineum]|uniref:penicillin-binding transpeptidase domain-containing protein n=1 Tax=Clostridium felsineum TaxID=36839 RepID=UPI00098C542F|nr:penicillin-binding transpeptidase domain-containing protein [Clostridium felsineum]URZ01189.1 Peptidoglycan D,D-transpeptidase MrdA [Clostridium felsineum]